MPSTNVTFDEQVAKLERIVEKLTAFPSRIVRTGLERRGFSNESIEALQTAFRLLTRSGLNTTQAIDKIRAEVPACTEVDEVLAFIAESKRGIVK